MYVGGEKAKRKLIVCDVRTEECNVGVTVSTGLGTTRERESER